MKKVFVIIIAAANIAAISCNDNGTKPQAKPALDALQPHTDNSITFKVDGQQVTTTGWNISRFDMGKGIQVNITSNMHDDKRTIMLNIQSDKPGKYALNQDSKSYGNYKPDYDNLLNAYSFESGDIIIYSIDTIKNTINASFEGVVKSIDGKTISITDGDITNGSLKPGIHQY